MLTSLEYPLIRHVKSGSGIPVFPSRHNYPAVYPGSFKVWIASPEDPLPELRAKKGGLFAHFFKYRVFLTIYGK